jgi:gas vesicle protein
MKTSSLFIGLGIGLLMGAAMGVYFASSEEDKTRFLEDINCKVDKAKKTIGKVVSDGLEELDKATEKVTKVAKETFSKATAHSE